jgi:hypothetical protein
MVIAYTKTTEEKVLAVLEDIFKDEFDVSVYTGDFQNLETESIQIKYEDPASELLSGSNFFMERRFFIEIRLYTEPDLENLEKYQSNRSDRFYQLLMNNITNSTNWYNLIIVEQSFPQDELPPGVLCSISLDNYTQG